MSNEIEIKSAEIKSFSLCRSNMFYGFTPKFILSVQEEEIELRGSHECDTNDLMAFCKKFDVYDTAQLTGKVARIAIRDGIAFAISNSKDGWIVFTVNGYGEKKESEFLKNIEILNS